MTLSLSAKPDRGAAGPASRRGGAAAGGFLRRSARYFARDAAAEARGRDFSAPVVQPWIDSMACRASVAADSASALCLRWESTASAAASYWQAGKQSRRTPRDRSCASRFRASLPTCPTFKRTKLDFSIVARLLPGRRLSLHPWLSGKGCRPAGLRDFWDAPEIH